MVSTFVVEIFIFGSAGYLEVESNTVRPRSLHNSKLSNVAGSFSLSPCKVPVNRKWHE